MKFARTLIATVAAGLMATSAFAMTKEEHKAAKIAVAAPLPGGKVFTGYFDMSIMDKALVATNIQADATMDAICANGPLIQQAWEDAEEDDDEDGPDQRRHSCDGELEEPEGTAAAGRRSVADEDVDRAAG